MRWSQTLIALIVVVILLGLAYQEGRENILFECKTKTFFAMHGHVYECQPYKKATP